MPATKNTNTATTSSGQLSEGPSSHVALVEARMATLQQELEEARKKDEEER